MLISLNWIRDFVDLPRDIDPRALAERFTTTTAEVEGVEQVTCGARGLLAAEVLSVAPVLGERVLFHVRIRAAAGDVETLTIAEGLKTGDRVIYAPPGATLPGVGTVEEKTVTAGGAQRRSTGMIVPGDALGLPTVGQRAVWLPPSTKPGTPIDMGLFDDWIIEVDNKSITHRPDLWGHYGIARELAAMFDKPLRGYPVTPIEELQDKRLRDVPIVIDDASKCPRYSALRFANVRPQAAPLWMQVRLAHVGLRPIDILVDLTNYIMAELGQPMHAFDAAGIERIEVAVAAPGETFRTLDGVDRTLPPGALMIQTNRRSVALAGIMGGADTEITPKTTELLLESANFEPATIRRCAAALGHRTDASARFEKSLDPNHTVLAIQRFVHLARPELPDMKFTSRLSDAFPVPPAPRTIRITPEFVARYIGRAVEPERIRGILTALGFGVTESHGALQVTVPSFRATKDITIEADLVEEVARFIGYGSIEPARPVVTVRYAEPDVESQLERRTLSLLCGGMSYGEIHRYIWFDDEWLKVLGFEPGPTIALRNPAAAGQSRLRTTLIPGMFSAADQNRRHLDRFEIVEIGSVFHPHAGRDIEERHLGLVLVAPGRKSSHEDELVRRLKTDLGTWALQLLGRELTFAASEPVTAWEHEVKTAAILLKDGSSQTTPLGRLSVVPSACRRRVDEHLAAWSIAIAELNLTAVVGLRRAERKLAPVPVYPQADLDFSVTADSRRRYAEIEAALATYDHPLLRRLAFVDSYEGGSIPAGQRSFTFRATIGEPARTLTEQDIQDFRGSFIAFLNAQQLTLRG